MPQRMLERVKRLLRSEPRRYLCNFERRRIVSMIDAGITYRTLVRQHGFTRAEIDQAIKAHVGRATADET